MGWGVANDTRQRMVRAAIELLRERGYAATSFHDVLERSAAPRGSIYHHFPDGKAQLVAEAVRQYSDATLRRLAAAATRGSSVETVGLFLDVTRDGLRASDFRAGCAVAAVVLDTTPEDAVLLSLTAAAFRAWREILTEAFQRDGLPPVRARSLAALVVAAVEGALILARAERDLAPVDDVAAELLTHVRSAVSEPVP